MGTFADILSARADTKRQRVIDASTVQGRPTCARAFCQRLGSDEKKFLRCSRCRLAFYCSPECQRADWKYHKMVCGRISDLASSDVVEAVANVSLNAAWTLPPPPT